MWPDPWFVSISVRVYGLFVCLYPRSFRREYGDAMIQLFHDASRDVYRESGGKGLFHFVVVCIAEYVPSILREYGESIMVNGNHFKQYVSRAIPACWLGFAVLALGLWVASRNDSIGLFSLSQDTSLRFTHGVMEFRHIYAQSNEAPIPREQFHEAAIDRKWFVPAEPKMPGFGFSSGHFLGLGGTATDGTLLATITPAEYGLLRVPLWILLIPFAVWSVLVLKRKPPRLSEQGAGAVVA